MKVTNMVLCTELVEGTNDEHVSVQLTKEEAKSLLKAFGSVRECDVMDVMEEDERAICWDLITELEKATK